MVDVQTATVVIAGISIIIGVMNSILSNRKADQQRQTEIETRQAELFMQMYRDWCAPEFRRAMQTMVEEHSWTDIEDFRRKYGSNVDPEGYLDIYTRQAVFYEGIGVLVEKGLIDIDLVDRLIRNTTLLFWEKVGPVFLEDRKTQRVKNPDMHPVWDSTEYLYNMMKQRVQQAPINT